MNLTISGDDLVVFINKKITNFNYKLKDNLEDYIKKLILKIKKIYKIKISGSYEVMIYQNRYYGLIIELNKKDNLEFFPDLIDLKINVFYDSEIFIELSDYFLISKYKDIYYYKDNYYLNIKNITNKDQIYLSEFCKYIYGEEIKNIKNKFMLVK